MAGERDIKSMGLGDLVSEIDLLRLEYSRKLVKKNCPNPQIEAYNKQIKRKYLYRRKELVDEINIRENIYLGLLKKH